MTLGDAWEAIDKLRAGGAYVTLRLFDDCFEIRIQQDDSPDVWAFGQLGQEPEWICRAALAAVE